MFGVPTETSIDISDIDAILISNSASILALPFFTENPNFNGTVFATEPSVTIGKFFMDEIVGFVHNVPRVRSAFKRPQSPLSIIASAEDDESVEEQRIYTSKGTDRPTSIFKLLHSSLPFPVKLINQCFNKELKEIYTKKSISNALLKVRILGYSEHTVRY